MVWELDLFQSTSPVWRTTRIIWITKSTGSNFNPRPPCGGRRRLLCHLPTKYLFQSTSPVWRTTDNSVIAALIDEFQSTSPVWRTTSFPGKSKPKLQISIHVPRVEDDSPVLVTSVVFEISIHVPRVEDDPAQRLTDTRESNFNPRPPCGGRQLNKS